MYKYLLCWRYLRSRYIALASIISVMLGVATMIVVNSVMTGFTREMQDRIHGILSDVVFECRTLEGMPDADARMREIREVAGEYIAGMTPTVHVPAMLGYNVGGQYVTKQVNLIGIDEATYSSVSDFGKYLQHPKNRKKLDFNLKEDGYDVYDHQMAKPEEATPREQMGIAGWRLRRSKARINKRAQIVPNAEDLAENPFQVASSDEESTLFNPAKEQHVGCVLGIGLCDYRMPNGSQQFLTLPGDDVELTFPSAGRPPKPFSAKFTITDFYESKMSEYDSSFVFVPIRTLQRFRGMIEPLSEVANFNTIRIRLKEGVELDMVRDLLRQNFAPDLYAINTWRDKQGALLAAVQMETSVLNLLLFMIILVSGFGILAIFCLIVVEKTRDIGVLRSLGASGWGILAIFLSYGLCLGLLGAGVGVAMGLGVVARLDEIAALLSKVSGRAVFDPSIYFFQKIPVVVEVSTVCLICLGAVLVAILASIFPSTRAALLHPVKALRYE